MKKIEENERCKECRKKIRFIIEVKEEKYKYGRWKCNHCGFTKQGVLPPRKTPKSEFPYREPERIKRISRERIRRKIKKLKRISSELIRFDLIDYDAGKGIVDDLEYCYWTIDGRRIAVRKAKESGTKCITQSWRPDPYYPNRKE